MPRLNGLFALFALILTSGCSNFSGAKVNPSAPKAPSQATLPDTPPSVISATVSFPSAITTIETAADSYLPYIIGEDDGHSSLKYGLYFPGKRDGGRALTITGENNVIYSRALLTYNVELPILGFASIGCGNDSNGHMRVKVGFDSILSFSDKWDIVSTSKPYVNHETQCRVSIFNVNQTGRVADLINGKMDELKQKIDAEIPSKTMLFKSKAEEVWQQLSAPISVADNLWLLVKPENASLSLPVITNRDISVSMNMVAHPQMRVSTSKPPYSNVPLPSLRIEPHSNTNFYIALDGMVNYDQASTIADREYAGRLYILPSGHKIKIDKVRIFGSGAQLIAQFDISGDLSGTLYLQGTPTYQSQTADGVRDVISVTNLDYTLETRNILLRVADWLLHDDLQSKLRGATTIQLTTKIDELKRQANVALNREINPSVRISGALTEANVTGVYSDTDKFIVRAVGKGNMALSVRL